MNPTKTTSTLMTPDPSEYNKPLNIHINNTPIPTTPNPTILGLPFDPKLKFFTHTDNTITKAKKKLNFLKLFTSTHLTLLLHFTLSLAFSKTKPSPQQRFFTLPFNSDLSLPIPLLPSISKFHTCFIRSSFRNAQSQ